MDGLHRVQASTWLDQGLLLGPLQHLQANEQQDAQGCIAVDVASDPGMRFGVSS
jgi:hypothetical protein